MTDQDQVPPPAGWYPDADSRDLIRWWNGTSWSDHVRPAPSSAAAPPAVAPSGEPGATTAGPAAPDAHDTNAVPRIPLAPEPLASPPVEPWPGTAAGATWQQPGAAWTPPGVIHPYATNPAATVSLVLGIVAIVLSFTVLPNIAAVVLGIIGLDRAGRARHAGLPAVGHGQALAGLILGSVAIILPIIALVLLAVFATNANFS